MGPGGGWGVGGGRNETCFWGSVGEACFALRRFPGSKPPASPAEKDQAAKDGQEESLEGRCQSERAIDGPRVRFSRQQFRMWFLESIMSWGGGIIGGPFSFSKPGSFSRERPTSFAFPFQPQPADGPGCFPQLGTVKGLA